MNTAVNTIPTYSRIPARASVETYTQKRHQVCMWLHAVLLILGGLGPVAYLWERSHTSNQNELMRTAVDAAGAGRWVWYLKTNTLVWDDQMYVLFGKDKNTWTPDYTNFLSCIHEDDRAVVKHEIDRCIKEQRSYQAVFRIITDAGETKYIRAAGKVAANGTFMAGINMTQIEANGNTVVISLP
jgi:hypothetical protein